MQEKTFYWYDFETFGLNRRQDRPAQFAGQRTAMDFTPLDEGEVFYAKPTQDYLPTPESCLLTGITPQLCDKKGVNESTFAAKIWERFNQPGTISIGYNTLGFDDEVARFLFWRNFLDPYTHQYSNGCSRWDIFPLVCAVWALRGQTIRWPQWEKIDPSREGVCFKLEYLSKANGIVHSHAHDALSDVEATMGLARLIAQHEPRLWQWALNNHSKDRLKAAIEKQVPTVWISPRFGQKKGFMKIVQLLAPGAYNNEVYVWDLSHDPSILSGLTKEDIAKRLFPSRQARDEGVEALPIYRFKLNTSAFACADLRVLSADRAAKFGIDRETILQHSATLKAVGGLMQGPLMEFNRQPVEQETSDVDFGLYEGFPSFNDKNLRQWVRGTTAEALLAAVNDGKVNFEDERYTELLNRYVARNWPELLSESQLEQWRAFCRTRILDGADGQLSVSAYFNEIDELQEQFMDDEDKQAVLEALYAWGEAAGEACTQ